MASKERRLRNLISTASLAKMLKKYGYEGYYAEPAIYRLFKEQGIEPKKTIGGKTYFNRKNATDCLIRNLFYVKRLSDEMDKKEIYDQLNKDNDEHGDTVGYGRNDMSTVSRELLAKDGVFGADENELYNNENKHINMKNNKLKKLSESKLKQIVKESVDSIILEKHRKSGVSRRIHTRDANGKKQSFDYIPNLPKYNKNLNFNKASKFQRINARQVDDPNGEDIDTVLKDGTIERKGLHLPQGYYNVNNVGGQEHWGIDPKTFAKKYELDPEMDGVYKPKGGPMDASEPLKRNVAFQAPWGGKMFIKRGGHIMRDPNNNEDTYGIAKQEFDDTYEFEECVKRSVSQSIGKILKENKQADIKRIVRESVNKVMNEIADEDYEEFDWDFFEKDPESRKRAQMNMSWINKRQADMQDRLATKDPAYYTEKDKEDLKHLKDIRAFNMGEFDVNIGYRNKFDSPYQKK